MQARNEMLMITAVLFIVRLFQIINHNAQLKNRAYFYDVSLGPQVNDTAYN